MSGYKDYISTLQPTTEGSYIAADLLLTRIDRLDKDDIDKLIELITTAEDGQWRSRLLICMAADARVLGKLSFSQFKRLHEAAESATETNKPQWVETLKAIAASVRPISAAK